jgi:hypothetical protein
MKTSALWFCQRQATGTQTENPPPNGREGVEKRIKKGRREGVKRVLLSYPKSFGW